MIAFMDQERRERLLRAAQADAELRRIATGAGALALAIGMTLDELFEGGKLAKLHCAREKDYLRERLGLPPRTGYQFLKLARETKGKDLLRRAVACGAVTPNKALAIAPVSTPELESAWVDLAMKTGLAELTKRVKDFGGEPLSDETPGGRMFVAMTEEERGIYDKAVEMARELLGPGTPRWVARESIAWEWLGDHGEVLLAEGTEAPDPPAPGTPADPSLWAKAREDVERELRVLEEAAQVVVEGPDPFCREPVALDARARRLTRTRERLAEPLGSLLRAFRQAGYAAELGYRSFEEYVRDRLGMSGRSARERIWLSRKLSGLPETRAALRSGKISYAKALALARVAEAGDEGPRVAAAATQSAEKVERATEAEQERRDRALGFLRMWGPEQAMESIRESIASARAALAKGAAKGGGRSESEGDGEGRGEGAGGIGDTGTVGPGPEAIPEGRALALTGAYFLEVWKEESRRQRRPRARVSVLARKDGLCQIPGCTNAVAQLHHIIFRSDGGSDAVSNLLGVCWFHHVQIHARLIRVWGLAGRRVVIEFLSAADRRTVLERWVTEGADRTRRVGAARDEAPAPADPAEAAPARADRGRAEAPAQASARADPKEGIACAG